MSLQYRVADQVLRVDDSRDATEAIVHKYDAFLNLLCSDRYAFQREAVRTALRFLVSDKYPDLERLARENWNSREGIRQRHEEGLEAYLGAMPLRDRKAVTLDLATGTGKSFVMYGLAAIALAEGLVDRVLVLCPSLTIEEGLLEKFTILAGNTELSAIMKELGALVSIPGIKRGNETIQAGEICIENIHAVYGNAGSSIADSFRGRGGRTLVLNDEAHHLFSAGDKALKEWIKFLLNPEFRFTYMVHVTGTAYLGNEYFPDVVCRYGLKQAIGEGIVKKPNYKLEDTLKQHDWRKTYALHRKNIEEYGAELKPVSIVVTEDIARCVEVWNELVEFLMESERLTRDEVERKAIWVTSGIPSGAVDKRRVEAAYHPRDDKDSPEKRRKENLALLKHVDGRDNPVEWIVSVSMLTEGWDVKNVFLIVPHESRAFESRLLIAQVLGRGLRVPPGLGKVPLVTINNHQAWSEDIGNLLKEVLEVENTLSWGFDERRKEFVFPLYNLRYETAQKSVESKREKARAPKPRFVEQQRKSTEFSTFSVTGVMAMEIEHRDLYEIEDAVKLIRLFLRDKDGEIAAGWPKRRLSKLIEDGLREAGQDTTFLSRQNLLILQQSFGPMFREVEQEHPRMGQVAKDLEAVDLTTVKPQHFSEDRLRESGAVWHVAADAAPFAGTHEGRLWEQYQKAVKMAAIDPALLGDDVRKITERLHQVDLRTFKSPWNVLYASHEPEREFTGLLLANAGCFDSFVRMPDRDAYCFPYSFKPAKAGRTHTANENFNPDYFIKLREAHDILVVEIKADGDDSNRNRAKCRDGLKHFELLNKRLGELGEPWQYHFYFLAPDDYAPFFTRIRDRRYAGWVSGLMRDLGIKANTGMQKGSEHGGSKTDDGS